MLGWDLWEQAGTQKACHFIRVALLVHSHLYERTELPGLWIPFTKQNVEAIRFLGLARTNCWWQEFKELFRFKSLQVNDLAVEQVCVLERIAVFEYVSKIVIQTWDSESHIF